MGMTCSADIPVQDLQEKLTDYLEQFGFQSTLLENLSDLDYSCLKSRYHRERPSDEGLTADEKWRDVNDYLLYSNYEGTLAYIVQDPNTLRIPCSLPFNVHFMTTAPKGLTAGQYWSLGIPQRNLELLKDGLHRRGNTSIAFISDLKRASILKKIDDELHVSETGDFPVHLFHSVYLSRTREVRGGHSDNGKAVDDLSKAISSLIVAANLFSKKQIAYYRAADEVDELFGESAIVT